jgi:acetyl-CoA carboxylase carboxyltransferase component
MTMHNSTFEYLQPSEKQKADMADAREHALGYAQALDKLVPDGPDKTYLMRKLREVAMWVNVAITREADGSPRT